MQVIGLCRFSYPAEGGFQVEHATMAERIAYLYAPARMEQRFRHFEAVALPGLKAQTDPDFTFLIVVGEAMPPHYLARLQALVADLPQARICARPPGPHRQVMQAVLNDARHMDLPCLQFRHDDDDAVAIDFVARLRQLARDCAGLCRDHRLVGLDFNRGYVARADASGLQVSPALTPFWGVALGVAVQPGVRQSIMNFAHNKLMRFMPCVSMTDSAMYVRGHNDYNDSRQDARARPVALSPMTDEQRTEFRNRFRLDETTVRRIFSAT